MGHFDHFWGAGGHVGLERRCKDLTGDLLNAHTERRGGQQEMGHINKIT